MGIRRIGVHISPGKKLGDPSQSLSWMQWHTHFILAKREEWIGDFWSRPSWTKSRVPAQEITKSKKAGDMAQVVEHLNSKCKALNLNLCTKKNLKH
jgi:hypothetical protein